MVRYEVLMLAVPEITQDESAALESQFGDLVKKGKGAVLGFDRWGKYRLAYPIKKNEYGIYYLARFEAENASEILASLKSFFAVDQHTLVMRHMLGSLSSEGSLEYKRPLSLEEAPPKEVGSFLREGGRPRGGFSRGPRGPREGGRFGRQGAAAYDRTGAEDMADLDESTEVDGE